MMEDVRAFWDEFSKHKESVNATIVLIFFILVAIFADTISPYDPFKPSYDIFRPPSQIHIFGTDHFGRDSFSRIVFGTRVALMVAVGSSGISAILGIFLGAIPGYYGGLIDDLLTRFFDIFVMIPRFFLMILIIAIYGSNITLIMIVIGMTSWVQNARMMRAQVLTLKTRPYVEAAKATGAGTFHLLVRHIIPNGIYPIIANTTLQMVNAIMAEASLSFLGLGDANVISWGKLIADSQAFLILAPWMAIFPGICLVILTFAFNVIGDGISYTLNPRLRERK